MGSPFPIVGPLCPGCLLELDRVQPDGDRPDVCLGVCRICLIWWVIDDDGVRPIYHPTPRPEARDAR